MESEKIKLKIGPTWTSVTCAFVFRNNGPACEVKVGFPDQAFGPHRDDASDDAKLHEFQVFVDGKKTSTTEVSGDEGDSSVLWHQRAIPFKRHQTRYILDQYRVRTGTAEASGNVAIHEVGFLMHTGSSWKGSIKKVNILAQFDDGLMSEDIDAKSARLMHVKWATDYENWGDVDHHTVYYHAFGHPDVDGNTLTFEASQLEPSKTSDIYLYFRAGGGHSGVVVHRKRKPVKRRRIRHHAAVPDRVFHPEETEQ
jgi:hypothetical protein